MLVSNVVLHLGTEDSYIERACKQLLENLAYAERRVVYF